MVSEKLDQLFNNVKTECLALMKSKNVDIEELSFQLGVSINEFIKLFQFRNEDFTFYLRTYSLLVGW